MENNDLREDYQLKEDIESWLLDAEIFYQKMLNKNINFQEYVHLKIQLRKQIFDYIKERENKNAK